MYITQFPIQKCAIFRKIEEIKGLCGSVSRFERDRTNNPADWRRDCGKGPFLDGNPL